MLCKQYGSERGGGKRGRGGGRKWGDCVRAAGYLNNHRRSRVTFPSFFKAAWHKQTLWDCVFLFSLHRRQILSFWWKKGAGHLLRSSINWSVEALMKCQKVNFFQPQTATKGIKAELCCREKNTKREVQILWGLFCWAHTSSIKINNFIVEAEPDRLKWSEKEVWAFFKGANQTFQVLSAFSSWNDQSKTNSRLRGNDEILPSYPTHSPLTQLHLLNKTKVVSQWQSSLFCHHVSLTFALLTD